MSKISKKDLVAAVAEKCTLSKKDAEAILDAYVAEVEGNLLAGNEVELFGFGKFEIKTRAARTGLNPATKEKIEIPESKAVGFKAAKALKNKING